MERAIRLVRVLLLAEPRLLLTPARTMLRWPFLIFHARVTRDEYSREEGGEAAFVSLSSRSRHNI